MKPWLLVSYHAPSPESPDGSLKCKVYESPKFMFPMSVQSQNPCSVSCTICMNVFDFCTVGGTVVVGSDVVGPLQEQKTKTKRTANNCLMNRLKTLAAKGPTITAMGLPFSWKTSALANKYTIPVRRVEVRSPPTKAGLFTEFNKTPVILLSPVSGVNRLVLTCVNQLVWIRPTNFPDRNRGCVRPPSSGLGICGIDFPERTIF